MSKYIDRGIMKWAPFEALSGQYEYIEELLIGKLKKAKPILSEDEFEVMNRNLIEAFENNIEISLKYYKNGFFYTTYGYIKKVDYIYKQIILSTKESFFASDIISIELIS